MYENGFEGETKNPPTATSNRHNHHHQSGARARHHLRIHGNALEGGVGSRSWEKYACSIRPSFQTKRMHMATVGNAAKRQAGGRRLQAVVRRTAVQPPPPAKIEECYIRRLQPHIREKRGCASTNANEEYKPEGVAEGICLSPLFSRKVFTRATR